MLSAPQDHLDWPFFEPRHRDLAAQADAVALGIGHKDHANVDQACRDLVAALGQAGLTRHCVPAAYGGIADELESRSLCLIRETLAFHDGLADFAFIMQGLGTGPISLEGSLAQRQAVLPKVARGDWIAAFALTEPEAGSDVAAITCDAKRDGDNYLLTGEKTWISNGGIADVYCVFARTGEAPGVRGLSSFIIYPDMEGFEIAERLEVLAPHPLARIRLSQCKVPAANLIGKSGDGFKLAMRSLDIFRASVAASALGFARRAFAEAAQRATARRMFGGSLADMQITQAKLADMATAIDAAALLTYRAAWQRDVQHTATTKEAAMAKLTATESAQQVIDAAVQMFGAEGLRAGSITERLYREIRALRIYEGASEVQKLIIAREVLKPFQGKPKV